MNIKAITEHQYFKPALGAVLTVLCGLLLWTPLGEAWENASYDYLFRFCSRSPGTNKVVLIQMDNAAHVALGQSRDKLWDRALHTQLLTNLTASGCSLVVFDLFFESTNLETDAALAQAMREQGRVVLAARLDDEPEVSGIRRVQIVPLNELLLGAATNWGVAKAGAEPGMAVRRHWPFPAPQKEYPSLPWVAAQLCGAKLKDDPQKQWLRYYGKDGSWEAIGGWKTIPYHQALSPNSELFSNSIVFVGYKPKTTALNPTDDDQYGTPYLRWAEEATRESAGGMEILATEFLNLMNHEWLHRSRWMEVLVLVVTGVLLGGGLCWKRSLPLACGLGLGSAFVVLAGAVCLSYFTDCWFPWLVVVGGQMPCALLCQIILFVREPRLSDYEFFHQLGDGAYGKVWLVRSSIGQWQALKVVEGKIEDCQREFRGVKQYKPISEDFLALLRVELISRKKRDGSFFYVMELGDALTPGWQDNPATYKSRDLWRECAKYEKYRLPPEECYRIGIELAEALVILHRSRLIHRDIKPSNAVFFKNRWKLADVGLIAEIPQPGAELTQVFTPEYVAPDEPAGTVAADIYAFGKMLFVISTGRHPVNDWPLPTKTLIESKEWSCLTALNTIFCKACRPLSRPGQTETEQRYATAVEMLADLRKAQKELGDHPTEKM